MNDLQLLTTAGAIIAILAVLLEMAAKRKMLPFWISRKLLHISAIGICGGIVLILERIELLRWIVAFACLLLFALVSLGVLFKEESGRRSWGIALFPLPYLFLLWLHNDARGLIALPMLGLAFCDAAAAIVGIKLGKHHYHWSPDQKSREGSWAFGLVALLLLSWPYLNAVGGLEYLHNNSTYLLSLPLIAFFSTMAEALGSSGNDNVWVPLSFWAGLLCMQMARPEPDMLVGLYLAIPIFILSGLKFRWLNEAGIAAASILGGLVMLSRGWQALMLPVFFLLSSTLLGKLRKSSSEREAKAGKPRDSIQVMANGGIFLILCCLSLIWPGENLLIAMTLSMSISTADTWASEVGGWLGGKTWDACTFQPIEKGRSGGVSIAGTIAALLGSMAIAGISFALFEELQSLEAWLIIAIGGFVGMLFDSVLGSRLQARYTNNTGQHADIPLDGYRLSQGLTWLNNDVVNLLSNGVITIAFLIGMSFQ